MGRSLPCSGITWKTIVFIKHISCVFSNNIVSIQYVYNTIIYNNIYAFYKTRIGEYHYNTMGVQCKYDRFQSSRRANATRRMSITRLSIDRPSVREIQLRNGSTAASATSEFYFILLLLLLCARCSQYNEQQYNRLCARRSITYEMKRNLALKNKYYSVGIYDLS